METNDFLLGILIVGMVFCSIMFGYAIHELINPQLYPNKLDLNCKELEEKVREDCSVFTSNKCIGLTNLMILKELILNTFGPLDISS